MSSSDFKQIQDYLYNLQYLEAIHLSQEFIAENPDDLSYYYYLGLALLLNRAVEEAEMVWLATCTDMEMIENVNEQLTQFLQIFANGYLDRGYHQQAIIIYQQIIELNPDHVEYNYNLGTALAHLARWHEAITLLLKVIELQPNHLSAHHNLAYIYQNLKNFPEAIYYYNQALALQTDDVDTIYWLGMCLSEERRWEEAIAHFQKVTIIKPDHVEAYCQWSDSLLKIGRIEEAISLIFQAIQLNSTFVENYLNHCHHLIQINSNKYQFFKSLYESTIIPELYLQIADYLTNNQFFQQALICYQKALELNPVWQEVSDKLQIVQEKQLQQDSSHDINHQLPGIYKYARDWVEHQGLQETNWISITPACPQKLYQPKTFDQNIYEYLKETEFITPATFVVTIPAGRIWLNAHSNAVIAPNNLVIKDISPHKPFSNPGNLTEELEKNHPIFAVENLPEITYLHENIAVLPGLNGDNYYHWMVDILPSLVLLIKSGIDINSIDKILINGYSKLPFQEATLMALNIPISKFFSQAQFSWIQANNLIVPSLAGHLSCISKWSCEFLRENLGLFNKPIFLINEKFLHHERIYISRQYATKRQVINEEVVITFLKQLGFVPIILEHLSLTEQIFLMHQTKVIVSPHGAGLTNTVFCLPGTKVIEILPKNFISHFFSAISSQAGLDYYCMVGDGLSTSYLRSLVYEAVEDEDIFINIDKLIQLLKLAEIL